MSNKIEIIYTPKFFRSLKKLEKKLQMEVFEKIDLFSCAGNHKLLKVHKLEGVLKHCYSFSVNYKYRIVFQYDGCNKNLVFFLNIGDHDIYI